MSALGQIEHILAPVLAASAVGVLALAVKASMRKPKLQLKGFEYQTQSPTPYVVARAIGFLAVRIATAKKVRRGGQISKALPEALDLLRLCIDAGLGLDAALSRVSLAVSGPLAEELGALVTQARLGGSRSKVIAKQLQSIASPPYRRFLRAIEQAETLGVRISQVVDQLAQDARSEQKDSAREQAQKVTVKILMPLMLCFLPAVFIVVLGPALVQLVKALSLL